jgi:hypothetical protein
MQKDKGLSFLAKKEQFLTKELSNFACNLY